MLKKKKKNWTLETLTFKQPIHVMRAKAGIHTSFSFSCGSRPQRRKALRFIETSDMKTRLWCVIRTKLLSYPKKSFEGWGNLNSNVPCCC